MKKIMVTLILAALTASSLMAQFEVIPTETSVFVPELIIAARQGDIQAISEFIAAGQYVDSSYGYSGITPLMEAAQWGNEAAVLFLVRNGAQVNKMDRDGRTALVHAAAIGSFNTVQTLLDFGADPNLYDNRGRTPLMLAAACGSCDSVWSLIQGCADAEMTCAGGLRAYDYAVASGNEDAAELITEIAMP